MIILLYLTDTFYPVYSVNTSGWKTSNLNGSTSLPRYVCVYIYTTSYAVPCNRKSVKSEVLSLCNICNMQYFVSCNVVLSSCDFFMKLLMHVYILSSRDAHCEGLFSYKESPKLIRRLRKVVSNRDLKGCFFRIHFSILLQSLKWSLTFSYSD
jgi:hypothetical protein